ncbi:hypothetical protein M0804_003351 [Polistes exclamans]|nr:hypothetical protein M0804_003351 [Polistes exclamans]
MKKLEFSFFIFYLALLVTGEETSLKELTLQVNTKKLISVSSDKFLSLAIDPLVILKSEDVSANYERSILMAKALSPAYLRLGGPEKNNWRRLNQWAEKTGLDVVACISPRLMGNDSQMDLVSLTDRMGFNASWQLGYECQTRCNFSGTDVGRYVQILRDKLNAIPRYSNSIITGPDVLDYQTEEQREYLETFFTEAEESLTAVTWHPRDFTNVVENEDGVFMDNDKFMSDKNNLYEILGHDVAKKPLWIADFFVLIHTTIAESKAEPRKNQFVGALTWTNRLGNTAKLGIEVLMRQPVDLSKPTPDYWVSVLHKKLVGREILDTRIQTDNGSHVHFYVQCTKASAIYQRGALTIFGINLNPMKIRANVKGFEIKNLHEYVLTPGFDTKNRMHAKTVLLNGKPLSLFKDSELPLLEPVIYNNEKGLSIELSSGGIGFWVVPDQKISSCMDRKVEKENVIVKTLRKENGILRKKRLIDYDKTIRRNKNKKWRRLAKRELDRSVEERKLKKIDMQEEHEKFEKVFPRKLARIERKRSTSESIDPFDFTWKPKEHQTMEKIRRSKKDVDKFFSDFFQTDQKYDRRRKKQSSTGPNKMKERENNENNLYGFSREDTMKNLPNVDVLLQIDDYTRKNKDYDYTKGEKVKEKGWKIVTIDHTKPENTWINVDNDYRGYRPNEIFETASIANVGMKENSNDYYTNIWQGENIQKHWVNQEYDKEDNAKTKPVTNVASGVGEGRRIKRNTVNMLMNYYSDSSAGKSNQENLEESFRVKTQGSKLGDSFVASLGKTKLTLPERRRRRRRAQTTTIEEDKMTDLDVLHYPKSIGVPMNIPTYTDSKQSKRSKRKVKNLDTILEKEMIDEDEANSKDCKCRVIRNFNDDTKFIPSKLKRRANKNYKVTTESGKGNVENYKTEQYEKTTEPSNENVEHSETKHYEETTESSNENIENYETEQYEKTTESDNENIENYETEQYEKTTESSNENVENSETKNYEETTEFSNENIENYEAEQLEKVDKQLVESINSELDQMDDHEINDSSTMITELSNQLSEILEDELNVHNDELETKEEKFFRGPSGQTKETEEEINFNKDTFEVIPKLSENITSISEKETKTTEIGINTGTSSTEETETEKGATLKRAKSSKRIKKQIRNVKKLYENKKRSTHKLKEERNQHNRRKRRELSEMIGSKLRPREEEKKIPEQYEDKMLDVIKGKNVNENKMKVNLRREIWKNVKNNEDDGEDMIELKNNPYVLIYEPIVDDILEKEKSKNRDEQKFIPLVVFSKPYKKIQEKLIESKNNFDAKSDRFKSRLIQSLRFPYNILDERKRYDKDQIAFDKGYYALVESKEEKNPRMFQYQRKSNEKLRNAYQSKGKEILSENSEIRTLKIPIGYIYDESAETMKSEEKSRLRSSDYKIYYPELEMHEHSSESLIYDDDPRPNFYNLILKPKFDKIIFKRLKSNQDQRNAPIFYISDKKKRPKNVEEQSEESDIVNNSTNSKGDDSKSMEENVTKEDYTIRIIPSSMENVKKIEEISKIEKNQENVKNRRTRRDVDKNERTRSKRHNYVNLNDDLMTDKLFDNSKLFSKLLKGSNLVESTPKYQNKNSRSLLSESFTENFRIKEDLPKTTIPLSKDIDLIENLDYLLLDDNKLLHYKPEENESSSSEVDEDETYEKYLTELDTEILNNEINRDDSKLNLKHVYNYIKENDDKPWKDINHENLNKKSEILEELWEFNRLSIPKEENMVDNFLEDFSRHDSVMKNNGRRDQPNGSNKSSFLRGAIPKLQEMITEGFDKAQNLTESLEEFTESIDKKFNGTLPKDDKNNIFQSATSSSMSTENIFQTMKTNLEKLFAFLFGFTRIFNEKL